MSCSCKNNLLNQVLHWKLFCLNWWWADQTLQNWWSILTPKNRLGVFVWLLPCWRVWWGRILWSGPTPWWRHAWCPRPFLRPWHELPPLQGSLDRTHRGFHYKCCPWQILWNQYKACTYRQPLGLLCRVTPPGLHPLLQTADCHTNTKHSDHGNTANWRPVLLIVYKWYLPELIPEFFMYKTDMSLIRTQ